MQKSDYIRINLASISDLPNMFIEKYKEFHDIEICKNLKINVSYNESISNSHGCPVGGVENWGGRIKNAPRSYPGWRGTISLFARRKSGLKTSEKGAYLDDVLFKINGFRGFHTDSGCPGVLNLHRMDMGFYFFLDDFPLLKKSKEKYKLLYGFSNKNELWENENLKYPS
jgi:hypothetical protein